MTSLLFSPKLEIYLSAIFDFSLTQQIHTVHLLGTKAYLKLGAGETKINIMWSLILRSLQSIGEDWHEGMMKLR